MKKQYSSPETVSTELTLESIIAASITGVYSEGLRNPIEMGGSAEEGQTSDSRRRRDLWDDDEEEEVF